MRESDKHIVRADVLLLLTSCIWGFGFVAQRAGMEYVGPFTYNGIRFMLGSLSLVPLMLVRRGRGVASEAASRATLSVKTALIASFCAGLCLFIAVSLQQFGIMYTTTGNSGFITGLYVVLTPIFGIFLGRKTGIPTWIGAALTVGGIFCISVAGHIGVVNRGDALTALSAVFWAFHVLLIDHLVHKVEPLALSSGQFACCGLCSGAAALLQGEALSVAALTSGMVPILYGGLGSVGVAYTLQVVAQ
ncbi:MAG: DMT family transporter, partial [Treponema sp.]|nr:DMT family transporter [Treponema sp.]